MALQIFFFFSNYQIKILMNSIKILLCGISITSISSVLDGLVWILTNLQDNNLKRKRS